MYLKIIRLGRAKCYCKKISKINLLESKHPWSSNLKQTTLGWWLNGTTRMVLVEMGGLKDWYTGVMVSWLPLKTWKMIRQQSMMMRRQSFIDYMSTSLVQDRCRIRCWRGCGSIIWKIMAVLSFKTENVTWDVYFLRNSFVNYLGSNWDCLGTKTKLNITFS